MSINLIFLRDRDHGGAPDQPLQVATALAGFLRQARSSLHIAIYDFRLTPGSQEHSLVIDALKERAAAGVEVRIAYDHGKGVGYHPGADPAPAGTGEFLNQTFSGTPVECRPVTDRNPMHPEPKLMHQKYVIRDGSAPEAAVWTGSTNWTEDSWTFMENNVVQIDSTDLAKYYEVDFQELWATGDITSSGANDLGQVQVGNTAIDIAFSPGEGPAIDEHAARLISGATRRIKVASMLLASRLVLSALQAALTRGQVQEFAGIYDATQMVQTLENWKAVPKNTPLIPMFDQVAAKLAHKDSLPYTPDGKHNFMHIKVLVCDDSVFTGSFNLSHSGTQNAENALIIRDPEIADRYSAAIDTMVQAYQAEKAGPAPERSFFG